AGSAATLIGNPQNIFLGAIGRLNFWTFLVTCAVPALFALLVVFVVVWVQWRRRMRERELPPEEEAPFVTAHPLDRIQTLKGVAAVVVLLILFATPLPREIGALIIAALLLAGSLTNLLIAEQSERIGARLSFTDHARAGIPIALLSLGFAFLWLDLIRTLPVHPQSLPPMP